MFRTYRARLAYLQCTVPLWHHIFFGAFVITAHGGLIEAAPAQRQDVLLFFFISAGLLLASLTLRDDRAFSFLYFHLHLSPMHTHYAGKGFNRAEKIELDQMLPTPQHIFPLAIPQHPFHHSSLKDSLTVITRARYSSVQRSLYPCKGHFRSSASVHCWLAARCGSAIQCLARCVWIALQMARCIANGMQGATVLGSKRNHAARDKENHRLMSSDSFSRAETGRYTRSRHCACADPVLGPLCAAVTPIDRLAGCRTRNQVHAWSLFYCAIRM